MSYTNEERKQIFKGQCFNISAVLVGKALGKEEQPLQITTVFELAQKLFDEGMERNWLNFQPEKMLIKATGEIKDIPIEQKGTMQNPITERDGIGKEEFDDLEVV